MKYCLLALIAFNIFGCEQNNANNELSLAHTTSTQTDTNTSPAVATEKVTEHNISDLDSRENTLLPTGSSSGSSPTNVVDKLIASSYKTTKHAYKEIQINTNKYSIYATLDTDDQGKGRLVGIGNILVEPFLGHESPLGYIYSPDKYMAIIQDNSEPGELFRHFGELVTVPIIMQFTPSSLIYENKQLIYRATKPECLATIPREYLVHFYQQRQPIGQFRLTCSISAGTLSVVPNSTVFFNGEPRGGFEIGIGGIQNDFRFTLPNACDDSGGINTATIAPPEPCAIIG